MRRAAAALATALVLVTAGPAWAADWGVTDLMASLAEVRSDKARFVEKSFVSLLKEPVESSGTLSYQRPDTIEKRTEKPRPESLRVEGDKLTLTQADGTVRSVSLSSMPEIEAYVESIRATLAGDFPTLRHFYNVAMDGERDGWVLQLTPLGPDVREMVRLIVISGIGNRIGEVAVYQTDGDRSVMTITPEP
jgi:outer membrane lipoprotein-sorting protein